MKEWQNENQKEILLIIKNVFDYGKLNSTSQMLRTSRRFRVFTCGCIAIIRRKMKIQDYLKKLKEESQNIFDETIKFQDELGRAHHFAACIFEFSEQIYDKAEKSLVATVSSQLESATLSATMGLYRQAFSSLRLALEMGLGAVYFSVHKLELNEWLNGCGDIIWSNLIDEN
jgi:hypothetical protein